MDEKLKQILQKGDFYGAYEIAMADYNKVQKIEMMSELAKNILIIGWFEMSINGGGLDSFIYSEVADYLDVLIRVSKEIEANYVLEALRQFEEILPDRVIPLKMEERFAVVDLVRENLGDKYWALMDKINTPLLFENDSTIDELFVAKYHPQASQ